MAPTIPRRLASTSDIDEKENRWSPGAEWLCANMHWHERHLLPTAVRCRQHNALHVVCGSKLPPLVRLLWIWQTSNMLEKGGDFVMGLMWKNYYQVSIWESVCGNLGYDCSLWFLRDSTALIRSGSYTRRRWDDDLKNSEGSASTNRTPSYQRRLASAVTQISAKTSIAHLIIRSLFHPIWCFYPLRRRLA